MYENALKIRATSGALLYVVATIERARWRATFASGVYGGITSRNGAMQSQLSFFDIIPNFQHKNATYWSRSREPMEPLVNQHP
eukprot:COSAG03_NODE_126_length_12149_cov_3.594274_14_plen_83_part_00